MKRIIVLSLSLLLLTVGCNPKHPNKVVIDPEFNPNEVGTILVTPAFSTVTEGEDPNRESEKIVNRILWDLLATRGDHEFLSPVQFTYIVQRSGVAGDLDAFRAGWNKHHKADTEFLRKLKEQIGADLLLITNVYLWYKDETDYRYEVSSSTTQVGVTLSLIDMDNGNVVWEAMDENYKEAVRSEDGRIRSTTGGLDRRVEGVTATGRDMYAAPPFEDVSTLVLEVLVNAIPRRGVLE